MEFVKDWLFYDISYQNDTIFMSQCQGGLFISQVFDGLVMIAS